jgi:hypothetical protein
MKNLLMVAAVSSAFVRSASAQSMPAQKQLEKADRTASAGLTGVAFDNSRPENAAVEVVQGFGPVRKDGTMITRVKTYQQEWEMRGTECAKSEQSEEVCVAALTKVIPLAGTEVATTYRIVDRKKYVSHTAKKGGIKAGVNTILGSLGAVSFFTLGFLGFKIGLATLPLALGYTAPYILGLSAAVAGINYLSARGDAKKAPSEFTRYEVKK